MVAKSRSSRSGLRKIIQGVTCAIVIIKPNGTRVLVIQGHADVELHRYPGRDMTPTNVC